MVSLAQRAFRRAQLDVFQDHGPSGIIHRQLAFLQVVLGIAPNVPLLVPGHVDPVPRNVRLRLEIVVFLAKANQLSKSIILGCRRKPNSLSSKI